MTERSRPEHYVGMDGGGTGCRVAIADRDGAIIAEATGGPANVTTDIDLAIGNILTTLREAAAKAGLSDAQMTAAPAHAGLAGVMTPTDARAVRDRLPFAWCEVSDDRLTSVLGALGARDGALVAVGTGSFVAVKRGSDVRYLGGWGLQIGDQASGAWLGRALLTRCVLVSDGLERPSDLTDKVLSGFGNDAGNITAFARTARPADYAKFAPEIVDSARHGDPNGLSLMQDGATYLARCLAIADLRAADVICMSGGLGPHYAPLLDYAFQARLSDAAGTALDGALALARQGGPE